MGKHFKYLTVLTTKLFKYSEYNHDVQCTFYIVYSMVQCVVRQTRSSTCIGMQSKLATREQKTELFKIFNLILML